MEKFYTKLYTKFSLISARSGIKLGTGQLYLFHLKGHIKFHIHN